MSIFQKRNAVCAIEIGTSKICVLIGEVDPRGGVGAVLGFSSVPSGGSVVKGEIVDMERCSTLLGKAMENADRASGGELNSCQLLTVLVTGGGVDSVQNRGIVTVKSADGCVTENDRIEAEANAKLLDLGVEREIINASTSFFLLDGRRVVNPLRLAGRQLEAHVHIIHAASRRIANFRETIIGAGVEGVQIESVFSPLASGFGVVDEQEKENGALLLDLGAGVTEYLVFFDRGVCASGVVQLGMEHVANDLSIALKLHIDTCRKLLESGELAAAIKEKCAELELPCGGGKKRTVPVATLELIADARLREIFELVRRRMMEKGAPRVLGSGGILTGGGAGYFRSRELFSDVFDMACRIGRPGDAAGADTLNSPRYSAVWGALKVAAFFQENYAPAPEGTWSKLMSRIGRVIEGSGR